MTAGISDEMRRQARRITWLRIVDNHRHFGRKANGKCYYSYERSASAGAVHEAESTLADMVLVALGMRYCDGFISHTENETRRGER